MIDRIGWPVHHAPIGLVRPLSFRNIIPVLDRLPRLELKDFKADVSPREVVFHMSEYKIAVLKCPNHVHPRPSLRQSFEEDRQALTALLSLRIVLDIFCFIDHRHRFRVSVSVSVALQKRSNLIFLRNRHCLRYLMDLSAGT